MDPIESFACVRNINTDKWKALPSPVTLQNFIDMHGCCSTGLHTGQGGFCPAGGTRKRDSACETQKAFCRDFYQQTCLEGVDHNGVPLIFTHQCRNWCTRNQEACTDKLLVWCKPVVTYINGQEKIIYNQDPACGCFQPESFYDDFRRSLAEDLLVPEVLLTGGRTCIYPPCAGAAGWKDIWNFNSSGQCQAINVANCVNDASINVGNDIKGNVDIVSSCNITFGDSGTGTGCTNDSECGEGRECRSERCQDISAIPDQDTSNDVPTSLVIGLAATGAAVIFVIGIVWAYRSTKRVKKKEEKNNTKTPL